MKIPDAVPKASTEPLPEIAEFLKPFAPLFRRSQSRHSLERYLCHRALDRSGSQELRYHRCGSGRHFHRALAAPAYRCGLGFAPARWRSREVLERKKPQRWRPSVGRDEPAQARQLLRWSRSPVLWDAGQAGQLSGSAKSAHYVVVDEPESSRPLHWPVSAQLYLPERWAKESELRQRTHVPEAVQWFWSKPQNSAFSCGPLAGMGGAF